MSTKSPFKSDKNIDYSKSIKWRPKGTQSKHVEDSRRDRLPRITKDTQFLTERDVPAFVRKQQMDENPNLNLTEKTRVEDWKRADPMDQQIDTDNMRTSKTNKLGRQETVFQHLVPSKEKPKYKGVKGKVIPYTS